MGLRPLACWDCGFESRGRHVCLSVVSVVCCQVEVCVSGWSLVQSSPTECSVSACYIEASMGGGPGPLGALVLWEKWKTCCNSILLGKPWLALSFPRSTSEEFRICHRVSWSLSGFFRIHNGLHCFLLLFHKQRDQSRAMVLCPLYKLLVTFRVLHNEFYCTCYYSMEKILYHMQQDFPTYGGR